MWLLATSPSELVSVAPLPLMFENEADPKVIVELFKPESPDAWAEMV